MESSLRPWLDRDVQIDGESIQRSNIEGAGFCTHGELEVFRIPKILVEHNHPSGEQKQ
jgi:aspartyl aminopeptidase